MKGRNWLRRTIRNRIVDLKRPKAEPTYEQFEVIETIEGSFEEFENHIRTSDSTIGVTLGCRGSGKSAIGLKHLENLKTQTDKQLFAMGFKKGSLPNWIKEIEDIEEVKNDSILLVDESGINFSSRNSMSKMNKIFSKMLMIARHKDLSILLLSQCSANIDVNAIRQTDYLVLKPTALLQIELERPMIKKIYEKVDEGFEKYKDTPGITCIYSDKFIGFVSNKLPSFWSERVSKAYQG